MSTDFRFPRETRVEDVDNETVVFEAGWVYSDRVWFCKVTKRELCVENYATTKRGALRLARRAWRKSKDKTDQDKFGYPRSCGE